MILVFVIDVSQFEFLALHSGAMAAKIKKNALMKMQTFSYKFSSIYPIGTEISLFKLGFYLFGKLL